LPNVELKLRGGALASGSPRLLRIESRYPTIPVTATDNADGFREVDVQSSVRFDQAHEQARLIESGLEGDRWPCLRRTPSQQSVNVLVRDGAAHLPVHRFIEQSKPAQKSRLIRSVAAPTHDQFTKKH
jgi:hypothetical protein